MVTHYKDNMWLRITRTTCGNALQGQHVVTHYKDNMWLSSCVTQTARARQAVTQTLNINTINTYVSSYLH